MPILITMNNIAANCDLGEWAVDSVGWERSVAICETINPAKPGLDALNRKIAQMLKRDPRWSTRAGAVGAGVAKPTAGNRIQRLVERGAIRVFGHIDLAVARQGIRSHLAVYVSPGHPDNILDALKTRLRLLVCDVASGRRRSW